MPKVIAKILESHALWFIARILILIVFVSSGLTKIFNYESSLAEMRAVLTNAGDQIKRDL